MSPRQPDSTSGQPRFGVFVTMTVGILLFFGMISKIHDLPGISDTRRDANADTLSAQQARLEEERNRAFVLFGGNQEDADAGRDAQLLEQQEVEEAIPQAAPVTPQTFPAHPVQPETHPQTPAPTPQPQFQQEDRRRWHVIRSGDTLWKIAQKYYGDGRLHQLIRDANPGINPGALSVNSVLVIPADRQACAPVRNNSM